MQAIHFSSMRIEIEKSVSSQPASQSVFYFFMLLDMILVFICGDRVKISFQKRRTIYLC